MIFGLSIFDLPSKYKFSFFAEVSLATGGKWAKLTCPIAFPKLQNEISDFS